ncbi:MAG: DUF4202 family protein, partial [bacterium]
KLLAEIRETLDHGKELIHGEETLKWLLKILPNAPWQLQIAALAHDIERAVSYSRGKTPPKPQKDNLTYDEYKNEHAIRSAKIMTSILRRHNICEEDVKRIANIIERHEVGGDKESDLVRDADSMRWFDSGHKKYLESFGIQGACEKGWWMYKRASHKAKGLIDSLTYDTNIMRFIDQRKNALSYIDNTK